ncbi:MAG TPA: hypothetical protein VM008_00205 [Phycisphaerae bacterium]|nr:hypothetical protein [Phycisphaerae bacterium]
MLAFPHIALPADGPLTEKELSELKNAVAGLAAGGNWKPAQGKITGVQTSAGVMVLQTLQPSGSMVGADPLMAMVRHTAFAAHAPEYVKRLVAEVERLQKELAAKG